MKHYKLPLFLIVLVSLVIGTVPCRAEVVYYTPEGIASKKYSVSSKDKRFSDPAEAAAAGYKVGQTVMVKNGILYKLALDSKTGRYSFKRYRVVKKKKTVTREKVTPSQKNKTFSDPSEAAAAGYKVGQTVMVKNGILYKLAQDSKTGRYSYKRYRVAKKKTIVTPKTVQSKTQADAHLKENTKVKVPEEAVEKVRTEVAAEVKRTKQEQARKERRRYPAESQTPNGRNMSRLTAAVALRHSFVERKTVITDRRLTHADGSTSGAIGAGLKDAYSTDMHNDSVRLRLGLTNTVEMFLDAGLVFDKLSDIADMEPAFGGGVRVNIATVDDGFFSGGYLAFSGEYLQGKLKTSYNSADGTVASSTAIDWQDMTATVESGIVFSKISIFTGCSYMLYSESIATKQTQALSDVIMLEDELEQQGSLNFSCGVEYHYSPSLHVQLELQAPNRLGGIGSIEYRF